MDKYRIDSHKLMYHIDRVHEWLNGKLIYPIYIEISPSGSCNHRCTFCALDFMEYQKRYISTPVLLDRIQEMGELGVKSIMFGGEGEPLLHKDMDEIIPHTKSSGIDVAVTTNGVMLKSSLSEKILKDIEWIKISLNAGSKSTYSNIHRTNESDFDKVINNLHTAAIIKQKNNYHCILGIQMILLPENYSEAVLLAKIAKDIGMDYLVIKPYSQHPSSHTDTYKNINYEKYHSIFDDLKQINDEKFSVIVRVNTMAKWDIGGKSYDHCYALPFWSYIDASGNIWGCSSFLGDEKFNYGNINQKTFKYIWEGEQRRQSLDYVKNQLNINSCRINCRMDECNRYLWELKHPPIHVNFI